LSLSAVEKNRGRTDEVTVNLCLNFNKDVYKDLLFAYLLFNCRDKARIEGLITDAVGGNLQEKHIICITFYSIYKSTNCSVQSVFVQCPFDAHFELNFISITI
jgi:hypothetical protein